MNNNFCVSLITYNSQSFVKLGELICGVCCCLLFQHKYYCSYGLVYGLSLQPLFGWQGELVLGIRTGTDGPEQMSLCCVVRESLV